MENAVFKPSSKLLLILNHLYQKTETLQEFVQNSIHSDSIVLPDDSEKFKTLLRNTLVCTPHNARPVPSNPSLQHNSHQDEIILRAIERIYRREGNFSSNLLTLGYGPMSDDPNAQISTSCSIELRHANNGTSRLSYSSWEHLLSRIGDDLMSFLLETRAIFLPVASTTCLIQLTGAPLYELWPFHRQYRPRFQRNPTLRRLCTSILNVSKRKSSRRRRKTEQLGKKDRQVNSKIGVHTSKHSARVEPGTIVGRQSCSSESQVGASAPDRLEKSGIRTTLPIPNVRKRKWLLASDASRDLCNAKKLKLSSEDEESSSVLTAASSSMKTSDESMSSDHCRLSGRFELSSVSGERVTDKTTGSSVLSESDYRLAPEKMDLSLISEVSGISTTTSDASIYLSLTATELIATELEATVAADTLLKTCDVTGTALAMDENCDCIADLPQPDAPMSVAEITEVIENDRNLVCNADKHPAGPAEQSCHNSGKEMQSTEDAFPVERPRDMPANINGENLTAKRRKRKGKLSAGNRVEKGKKFTAFNHHLSLDHTVMFYSRALSEKFPPSYVIPGVNVDGAKKLVEEVLAVDILQSINHMTLPTTNLSLECTDTVKSRLVEMMRLLIRNHLYCRYKYLLTFHCSVENDANTAAGDGTVKKPTERAVFREELPSKSSTPNLSKATVFQRQKAKLHSGDVSEDNLSGVCPKGTKKRTARRNHPKLSIRQLLEQNCSRRSVYLFLRACCLHVVPASLFGSCSNRNVFFRNIRQIIGMGQRERLSLGSLMTGMKVTHCRWMSGMISNAARLRLLAKLLYWLFGSFILRLVRSYFYVTETAAFRNRMFFFRKSVWKKIHQKGLAAHLRKGILKPINEQEAKAKLSSGESLGIAHLRFLPKATSLRPIINLSKRQKMLNGARARESDINQQLRNIQHVLAFERECRPATCGSSIFSLDEIYAAWKRFVTSRQQRGDTRPLYFVKLDIEDCYDSVDQGRLFEIISDVIAQQKTYLFRKYVRVIAAGGHLRRTYQTDVSTLQEYEPSFLGFAKKLVEKRGSRNAIFVDQIMHPDENSTELLRKLRSHLFHNIVKVGRRYFIQAKGIAQGSVISTLLCNNYYGKMESERVAVLDESELLMRQVDDFLLVTPNLNAAVTFLRLMLCGITDYNCQVNPRKTLVNFACNTSSSQPVPCLPSGAMFPWCGLLIDTESLAVCADFTRYAGISIPDTMRSDASRNPGIAMRSSLLFAMRVRCHPIYLDSSVNPSVGENIFRLFLLSAFRLHSHVRRLPLSNSAVRNPAFVVDTVFEMASFVSGLSRNLPPCNVLEKQAVQWLCVAAFQLKLGKHQGGYQCVLTVLERRKKSIEKFLDAQLLDELKSIVGKPWPSEFNYILD